MRRMQKFSEIKAECKIFRKKGNIQDAPQDAPFLGGCFLLTFIRVHFKFGYLLVKLLFDKPILMKWTGLMTDHEVQ